MNQGSLNGRNLLGQPGGAALGESVSGGNGNALDNLINGNGATNELRGEAGNDSLDGKVGNDLLDGGAGRDLLTGGSGADRFRFATAGAFGTAQADLVRAMSSSTLLIQDLRDGSILFNQNGTAAGAGQGGVFAVVSQGLTLQAGDFALGV